MLISLKALVVVLPIILGVFFLARMVFKPIVKPSRMVLWAGDFCACHGDRLCRCQLLADDWAHRRIACNIGGFEGGAQSAGAVCPCGVFATPIGKANAWLWWNQSTIPHVATIADVSGDLAASLFAFSPFGPPDLWDHADRYLYGPLCGAGICPRFSRYNVYGWFAHHLGHFLFGVFALLLSSVAGR